MIEDDFYSFLPVSPGAPDSMLPLQIVDVETYTLSPVTESSGLKGILLEVLGPYDTVVTQYRYQQGSNQYYSYVHDIQPDYPWIASAVLFIVLLLSVFKALGRSISWTP